jgi:hypothetical protein
MAVMIILQTKIFSLLLALGFLSGQKVANRAHKFVPACKAVSYSEDSFIVFVFAFSTQFSFER